MRRRATRKHPLRHFRKQFFSGRQKCQTKGNLIDITIMIIHLFDEVFEHRRKSPHKYFALNF